MATKGRHFHPKHFVRQIYFIDTKFSEDTKLSDNVADVHTDNPTQSNKPRLPEHTLEDYAAEMSYRIGTDLMKEWENFPKDWRVNIIRDTTPDAVQLSYRILTRMPKKSDIIIMSTTPKDIVVWYNPYEKASNALIILTNAERLNIMADQMLHWKDIYSYKTPLIDNDNNFYFEIYSKRMEPIPKFATTGARQWKYRELLSGKRQ